MFRLFRNLEDEGSETNPSSASGIGQAMLSEFRRYLLGKFPKDKDTCHADDVEFDIQETELGWELVETRNPAKSSDEEVIVEAGTEDASQPDLDDVTATSTYLVNREDGWVMTPLPCFTAAEENPSVEDSPYENLLIEHPSMSVYASIEAIESEEDDDDNDDDSGNEKNVCMHRPLWEVSNESDLSWVPLDDELPSPRSPFAPDPKTVPAPPRPLQDPHSWFSVGYLPEGIPFPWFTTMLSRKPYIERSLSPRRPHKRPPLDEPPQNPLAAFEQQGHRCERRTETRLELMARVKTLQSPQRKQQKEASKGLSRKTLDRSNANCWTQSLGKKQNKRNQARNTSGAMKTRVCQRRH